ncbi:hypothetical protein F4604DRAFT_1688376 [Suillus subluteus]|nr:hypothetical protein F4604DRAFT_1688376 [Suillus subluteus]
MSYLAASNEIMELFLSSLEAMADWTDIYQDPEQKDKSGDWMLICKDVPDAQPGTGMLGKFRVERFRNWSSRESEVAHAVQYVHVSSGGHLKPWGVSIDCLILVCEYVSRWLHMPMQGTTYKKEIYMHRRTFIKMTKQGQVATTLSLFVYNSGDIVRGRASTHLTQQETKGNELSSDGGCVVSIALITEVTKDDQDKPKNSSMEPNPSENATLFESISCSCP